MPIAVIGIGLTVPGVIWIACPFRPPDPAGTEVAPLVVRSGSVVDSLLISTPDHGYVTLPKGRYLFHSPLVIDRPVHLRGEEGTVLELLPGSSTSLIEIRGSSHEDTVTGVVVERLHLVGNRESQRAGDGVLLLSAVACTLRSLAISSFWEDGVYGSNVRSSLFEDLVLRGCGRNGFAFGEAVRDGRSTGSTIRRCTAEGNDLIGIDLEPGDHNTLEDCRARVNASYGISVGAEGRSHHNRMIRCLAEANGQTGINLWSDANTLLGCTSRANGGDGIGISGPVAVGNRLIDCLAERNGRHGIDLDRTSETVVSSCRSIDNGRCGVGDGIALTAGVPVYDNRIEYTLVSGQSHRYALIIAGQVHRTTLVKNQFSGLLLLGTKEVIWR